MHENKSVTALATITGMLLLKIPNSNHKAVPNVKMEYMSNEIPEVSFVRMVCIACGKKEKVVQAAATNPNIVIEFK
jgi:hypothetical protein